MLEHKSMLVAVFTCDNCGKKELVESGEGLPEGWKGSSGRDTTHLCGPCNAIVNATVSIGDIFRIDKSDTFWLLTGYEGRGYALVNLHCGNIWAKQSDTINGAFDRSRDRFTRIGNINDAAVTVIREDK